MSPFLHACTACTRTQLIFPSQVSGLDVTDRGTELHLTCWCGAEQVHLDARMVATQTTQAA